MLCTEEVLLGGIETILFYSRRLAPQLATMGWATIPLGLHGLCLFRVCLFQRFARFFL